jgi:hypothetical protein
VPSYSPVFSAPFIESSPTAPNTAFGVPDGFTAVVRQISVSAALSSGIMAVNIQDSDAAPFQTIHQTTIATLYSTQHTQGRWVVPGGGIISIYQEEVGDEFYIYVGGYLLRNTLT